MWKRPGTMMKTGKPHDVTLNAAALAILERAQLMRRGEDDLVFPSSMGTPLSDATLSEVVRDASQPVTVHGFRSSLRDWAAEQMPTIPDPVAEAALAHLVSDKVVAAYKRTTFIDMRRRLLESWCKHVNGATTPEQSTEASS